MDATRACSRSRRPSRQRSSRGERSRAARSPRRKRNILVIIGTRPEAIKLAPVVLELRRRKKFQPVVCATGQHRELLNSALSVFGLRPDIDLKVMRRGQELTGLASRLMEGLGKTFADVKPDFTLVQGDTTTAFCGALASFYARVSVGHVEAGLRSGDFQNPFPEEMNRTLADRLSNLCFAPTPRAAELLRAEGVPKERVVVTGNTVIDALFSVRAKVRKKRPRIKGLNWRSLSGKRLVLITCHRRESFGAPLESICRAIASVAERHPDIVLVYPVHPNPNVSEPARRMLGTTERVKLIEPVGYVEFVALMDASELILTDSGGVQEEAPSLGVPVLVMREKTERPEGVEAGNALLVGTGEGRIVREASRLLADAKARSRMARAKNPYGDGKAAQRIADSLERRARKSR